jgi:hypothetical protein
MVYGRPAMADLIIPQIALLAAKKLVFFSSNKYSTMTYIPGCNTTVRRLVALYSNTHKKPGNESRLFILT